MKTLGVKIWKGLLSIQRGFIIIAGCVVIVLIFVEVMLRYVFGSPLFGVEEMVTLIAMWLYFLGAAYGAYERSHIKAELVHLWFKTPRSLAMGSRRAWVRAARKAVPGRGGRRTGAQLPPSGKMPRTPRCAITASAPRRA